MASDNGIAKVGTTGVVVSADMAAQSRETVDATTTGEVIPVSVQIAEGEAAAAEVVQAEPAAPDPVEPYEFPPGTPPLVTPGEAVRRSVMVLDADKAGYVPGSGESGSFTDGSDPDSDTDWVSGFRWSRA